MPFSVSAKLEGVDEMLEAMEGIKQRLKSKALRKGVRNAGKAVLRKARSLVRVESGLLKRSLGVKVVPERTVTKDTGKWANAAAVIVGPRVGFKMEVARGKRTVLSNPTKYAHLVELGTSHGQAFPFLGPAFESSKGEARDAIADAVNEAINGK